MLHDLRFALRTLIRHPGFASTAAATFAIGIGALAVTFSLVNALLLRPLQVADADRLVIVANKARRFCQPDDFDTRRFCPDDFDTRRFCP